MNELVFLYLDTSTTTGSVCLFKGETVLGERVSTFQKSHSEFFNQALFELLAENGLRMGDLKFIATSSGPGSFTGIRVGLSLVKTISYLYKIPIVDFNSLEAIAYTFFYKSTNRVKDLTSVYVMTNAYKNMVYFSKFEMSPKAIKTLIDCRVIPVAQLGEFLVNPGIILGDALDFYPDIVDLGLKNSLSVENFKYPLARALGQQSLVRFMNGESKVWNHVLPLYLKASEAEENLRKGMLKVGRRI